MPIYWEDREPADTRHRVDSVNADLAVYCPNCNTINNSCGAECIVCGSAGVVPWRQVWKYRLCGSLDRQGVEYTHGKARG